MRAPTRARPPRTPITMPAMEPPLNFELVAVVLADAESAPEVALDPATVIVLTWPPAFVWTETVDEVLVVLSDEVDEVDVELDVEVEVEVDDDDEVVVDVVEPPAVLVTSLPVIST